MVAADDCSAWKGPGPVSKVIPASHKSLDGAVLIAVLDSVAMSTFEGRVVSSRSFPNSSKRGQVHFQQAGSGSLPEK